MNSNIALTAYRLLPQRLWFKQPFREKLLKKFPKAVREVDQVVRQFEDDGYLDDQKHAEQYLEYQLSVGTSGPMKLQFDLRKKGVDQDIINHLLASMITDESAPILALLERRYSELKSTKLSAPVQQKIYRWLVGRGFRSGEIVKAMREYF